MPRYYSTNIFRLYELAYILIGGLYVIFMMTYIFVNRYNTLVFYTDTWVIPFGLTYITIYFHET